VPDQLRDNPKHPYTRELMASRPASIAWHRSEGAAS
jgi:peptide/nickel transport system ATP-binding protein